MANFRAERLFICCDHSVTRFDPNAGIDHEEFAWIMVNDQDTYDERTISDFTFAPFDEPKWFPAAEGLAVVRRVRRQIASQLPGADEKARAYAQKQLDTLDSGEASLDHLDSHDCKFHFLARDLG